MALDIPYDTCLPILQDTQLDEEERTEKIEVLLKDKLSLEGQSLEDAVLNVLWQYRTGHNTHKSIPPARRAIVRSNSPSPWQHAGRPSTPSAVDSSDIGRASPILRPTYGSGPPSFVRSKSFGTGSPFSSPRPSPRLAFANSLAQSPILNNYAVGEGRAEKTEYGDYGSDTIDWLVNDDSGSRPPSSGAGSVSESGLNAAAAPWVQPHASEMSSYDILRSVMGDGKTDEEIEAALDANGYDLSSTIMTLMGATGAQQEQSYFAENDGQIVVGKSMNATNPILIDQQERARSNIICKYWLANGNCLRADCRFNHDLSSHICK